MDIIELKGIYKRFGSFYANKGINLSIRAGEIHALLGENGAGKTTLMNILYGLYPPSEGEIWFENKKVSLKGPGDAMRLSIGMVHQHFMLIPPFTVAENLILGNEPVKGIRLDMKAAIDRINGVSREYGLMVDPAALVSDISVGMQQRVELLKILLRGAKVLIFDEPTAVLTPQEIDDFFKVCKTLQKLGHTIIIITHKLKEIKQISDRVTVIRGGENVGTVDTCATNEAHLAEMMVGRPVLMEVNKQRREPGGVVLEIDDLAANDYRGLPALKGISLNVRAGEIVGIAGVEGNGQTELAMVLKGLMKPSGGVIKYFGRKYTGSTTTQKLIDEGLAHIPEDRQRRGLIPGFSIKENLILGAEDRPRFVKGPFLNQKEIDAFGEDLRKKYDIRCSDIDIPVEELSGGNQQKVILAREISKTPKLLIVCQPTRGLDVGAVEYVYAQLLNQRERGCAILLISYELDEILSLSDRILAIYDGKIAAGYENGEIAGEQIGLAMTGFGKGKNAG
jgi:simple sugar transport system ATP-binding protein